MVTNQDQVSMRTRCPFFYIARIIVERASATADSQFQGVVEHMKSMQEGKVSTKLCIAIVMFCFMFENNAHVYSSPAFITCSSFPRDFARSDLPTNTEWIMRESYCAARQKLRRWQPQPQH
jgi:hypothetical protein